MTDLEKALSDLNKAVYNLESVYAKQKYGGYLCPLPEHDCGCCDHSFRYCETCKGLWCPCSDCRCEWEPVGWMLP